MNRTILTLSEHPHLDLAALDAEFPAQLGDLAVPASIADLLRPGAAAPVASDAHIREAVRALLRWGGFKPTGRSKPASEYLLRAVAEGQLSSINLAVDVCNAVSFHSGLPISVVDLDRARPPLHVAIAPPGSSYVFNAAGQVMDLGGLLALFDADGPCGNAVKDSQRTKTGPETRRTLSLIWGTRALPGRAQATAGWYRELLVSAGATVTEPHLIPPRAN